MCNGVRISSMLIVVDSYRMVWTVELGLCTWDWGGWAVQWVTVMSGVDRSKSWPGGRSSCSVLCSGRAVEEATGKVCYLAGECLTGSDAPAVHALSNWRDVELPLLSCRRKYRCGRAGHGGRSMSDLHRWGSCSYQLSPQGGPINQKSEMAPLSLFRSTSMCLQNDPHPGAHDHICIICSVTSLNVTKIRRLEV